MLILSRKLDEAITIGGKIVVKVIAIQDGQVKLGIEAPKDVLIYRLELYQQIQQQNLKAAGARKQSVRKAADRLQKSKPSK